MGSPGRRVQFAALIAGVLGVAALTGYGIYALMGGRHSSGAAWGTKLGVSVTDSGQFVIHVLTCPGERVRDVKIAASDPQFSTTGAVLWEIESPSGSSASEFVLGTQPSGFTLTVPLVTAPLANQPVIVNVITEWGGASFAVDFFPRELLKGTVYVGGPGLLGTRTNVTPARFDSVRGEVCRLQVRGPGG